MEIITVDKVHIQKEITIIHVEIEDQEDLIKYSVQNA